MSDPRETWIGKHPDDGREYDCQCARCGSTLTFEACEECGGDGHYEDVDGPDAGGFYDDGPCNICAGKGAFPICLSTEDWCNANPMPGRAETARHTAEWFLVIP